MAIDIRRLTRLTIGINTESGVEEYRFDMLPWLEEYPGLHTFQLNVTPPGGMPYMAETHMEGDVLVWPITASDTALPGDDGWYEIEAFGDDGLHKLSPKRSLAVMERMVGDLGDAPQTIQNWVEAANKTIEKTVQAAADAETAIREANRAIDTANAAVSASNSAADTANTAANTANAAANAANAAAKGAEDATAAAESVCRGAVVRNWLDNSDFQINQRGLTEYTTTSSAPIYTVDRWKMNCWNTTASLRVESKGVRLVGGADGPNSIALLQTVDALKLRGKALTVAVKMGNLTSTVRKFFIYFNNEENYVEAGLTANGIAIINAVVPADANTATVYIGNQGSWGGGGVFDGLIEWVALYEGTYTPETLPAYQPKGYAAELAECQMRYRLFKDISVPWSNNHEGNYIEGFLPISMKSETGGIDIQCEQAYVFYGGQYKTVTSLAAYQSGSGVKIACTTDSANSSNQDGMIFASTLVLSREL